MDSDRLAQIREREARATPPPWAAGTSIDPREAYVDFPGHEYENALDLSGENGPEDAAFIAHARVDVPWLLSEVERLERERDEARRALERCARYIAGNLNEELSPSYFIEHVIEPALTGAALAQDVAPPPSPVHIVAAALAMVVEHRSRDKYERYDTWAMAWEGQWRALQRAVDEYVAQSDPSKALNESPLADALVDAAPPPDAQPQPQECDLEAYRLRGVTEGYQDA